MSSASRGERPAVRALTEPSPRLIRGLLAGLVVLLGFSARGLLGDLPIYGDDHSSHFLAIRHFIQLLEAGERDFFMPTLNLGFPMYLYYQPLPHLTIAALHFVTFGLIPLQLLFNVSVLVLWSLYPVATYVGLRRLGLDALAALLGALCAPLVSSDLPFGFTLDSIVGPGLYTQLFAMVVFPVALGSLWRALEHGGRRYLVSAAVWMASLCLSHFFYGVALASASLVMVLVRPAAWRPRLTRLCASGALVAAGLLFWLIPLGATRDALGGWPGGGEDRLDGYGLGHVVRSLATGALLDHTRRVPLLTLGFGLGLALVLGTDRRRDPRWRMVLLAWGLFVFFLMGRRSFGPLVLVQPANATFELFRYIGPVHAVSLVIIGLGLGEGLRRLGRLLPSLLVLAAAAAVLVGPFRELTRTAALRFQTNQRFWVKEPDLSRAGALIEAAIAAGAPPGRIYAHGKTGTGSHLVAHALARHTEQPLGQSYAVGMHDSLSFFYLQRIDPFDLKQMALFNFRYVLATEQRGAELVSKVPGARLLGTSGALQVYALPGSYGYFEPVRLAFRLLGKPHQLRPAIETWLQSPWPFRGAWGLITSEAEPPTPEPSSARLPLLRVEHKHLERAAGAAWRPLLAGKFFAEEPPALDLGTVKAEHTAPNQYRATVEMNAPGTLALKVTYHPWWHVTVDGRPAPVLALTPSFLGVDLPAGRHDVVFRFRNPRYQKLLGLFSLLFWLGLGVFGCRAPRAVARATP